MYGHSDSRYSLPQVPYLEHLQALLENSRPEFSLEWTPDSEQRVDEFFRRTETPAEAKRVGQMLGEVRDAQGRVTRVGRYKCSWRFDNPCHLSRWWNSRWLS